MKMSLNDPKKQKHISQKYAASKEDNTQTNCEEETISLILYKHNLLEKSSKYSKVDEKGLR